MIFPKDEGVGDWKSWNKFELGRSPILEKEFFEFLGQENTKNDHLFLMQQRFTFSHDFGMEKYFGKINSAFT